MTAKLSPLRSNEMLDGGSIEKDNFAIELTDKTKSHEEWLAVVRFGLGTLLQDQHILIEVIVREAQREAAKHPHHVAADHAASILRELGLRLEVAV